MTDQPQTQPVVVPSPPAAATAAAATNNELEALKKQAAEYLAGWQRAKADYLNLKKQADRERQDIVQFSTAAFVLELLPIYHHFKLAVSHVPADQAEKDWVKGFGHILQQMKQLFQQMGIEDIKTVGAPFNPELHHAVSREKREGVASGTILSEAKTGFTMHGKVIEPAQVVVAE